MAKRHQVALDIQKGASNPIAICNALSAAFQEVHLEARNPAADRACKLICHQLAYVMGLGENFSGSYSDAVKECEEEVAWNPGAV